MFCNPAELEVVLMYLSPIIQKAADKNDDGKLSKRELRIASEYIVRRRCPKIIATFFKYWKNFNSYEIVRNTKYVMQSLKNLKSGEKQTIGTKMDFGSLMMFVVIPAIIQIGVFGLMLAVMKFNSLFLDKE